MELRVTFKGQVHSISLGSPQADASSDTSVSLAQLGEAVAAVTGVAYHTIKLLVPGVKGPVIPSASPSRACHVAGEKQRGCGVHACAQARLWPAAGLGPVDDA